MYPYNRYYMQSYRAPHYYQGKNNYLGTVNREKYCDYFDLGENAPDFTLDGIVNGKQSKVSLSDFKGKWVVLFFYGSNFTFV